MKNFSHSWDSTCWATEYPCSYSVLTFERALVRAEQKQDLFWLLWFLWPSLNAVLQTTSFFLDWFWWWLFLSLGQIFSQCLSIYKLISVFCSMKCHHFLRPSFQVPGTSFLPFLICQHLSFVTWCFCKNCYLLLHFLLVSWQFPWFIFLLSFLCFRRDTWGGKEITYWLQALITHSAELSFKIGHVCPTIWLKAFSLS